MRKKSKKNAKTPYKSGLEELIAKKLTRCGINPNYEGLKLSYVIPQTKHSYTPDFPVSGKIIIETKGRFLPADRQKMLYVKEQYPQLDFRFIFSNSKSKINKKSNTTYGDWCDKKGFKYADKEIPSEWIEDIKNVDFKKEIKK